MTPGPTPVSASGLLAQAQPAIYHRGHRFAQMLEEVIKGLQWLLQTDNDVLVLTGSGTGALEAAIVNCFSPGEKVLVAVNGFFGDRVQRIATAFGLDVRTLDYEMGEVVKPEDVAAALDSDPTIAAVMVQHSETSAGVVNDVEGVAAVVAASEARPLLLVDAVSSVGSIEIRGDAWGLDLICGASQKGLAASPGVSFVAVSDRAWQRHATARLPRFYWDFSEHRKTQQLAAGPESPWTPAVSVLAGLAESLRTARGQGQDRLFENHRVNSDAVKAGVRALGLDVVGENIEAAVVTTTVQVPGGLDGNDIVRRMRSEYGVVIAPGMGSMKGKVFRIGHIGHISSADVITTIATLEMTLKDLGVEVTEGAGVAAATETYRSRSQWV